MPEIPELPKYLNNMGKGLGLDARNIRVCQLASNYFEVWRQETVNLRNEAIYLINKFVDIIVKNLCNQFFEIQCNLCSEKEK